MSYNYKRIFITNGKKLLCGRCGSFSSDMYDNGSGFAVCYWCRDFKDEVSVNKITEDFWVVEEGCKPTVDKLELVKEALLEYEEWLRGCRGWITPEDVRSRIIDFINIVEGVDYGD